MVVPFYFLLFRIKGGGDRLIAKVHGMEPLEARHIFIEEIAEALQISLFGLQPGLGQQGGQRALCRFFHVRPPPSKTVYANLSLTWDSGQPRLSPQIDSDRPADHTGSAERRTRAHPLLAAQENQSHKQSPKRSGGHNG